MSYALQWGVLYHMLGLHSVGREALKEASAGARGAEAKLITAISGIHNHISGMRSDPHYQSKLLEIVRCLGNIVDPDTRQGSGHKPTAPYLEPRRGSKIEGTQGYSRDPFKTVASDRVANEIALVASCYLLRSYALFFCRPRNFRNFTAAKTALNDIHQAFQLGWRLYQRLDCCHHDDTLKSYFNMVRSHTYDSNSQPGESPYFVWAILFLCDVQRGNIYRQIGYIHESDRHYRHAGSRFDNLDLEGDIFNLKANAKWFVVPTLLRALLEESKTQFDLGQFPESLLTQVTCLEYMLRLHDDKHPLLDHCREIREFLRAERGLPIIDKAMVAAKFGLDTRQFPFDGVAKAVPRGLQRFAVELFSRMGFALFTLRPRTLLTHPMTKREKRNYRDETAAITRWLNPFFRMNEKFGADIKQSSLGAYCETLLLRQRPVQRGRRGVVPPEPERALALLLRDMSLPAESHTSGLEEHDFYKMVLTMTTENINNMVTIPRRNRKVLMRHGYLHRKRQGDLSETRVFEGVKKALGRRKDNPGDPRNKFVVLRRWQSYNPKAPGPQTHYLRGGGYFLLWNGKGIVIDPGFDFIQNFYDEGFSLEDVHAVVVTHTHPDHDDDLASLTTLIREWNEYQDQRGADETVQKRLDLFLNDSAHRKFSAWLQAHTMRIGRVVPLPTLCWDKDTKSPGDGPIRGRNPRLELLVPHGEFEDKIMGTYDIVMEVVPAWHNDVIGQTAAVGLKIHLHAPAEQGGHELGVLGLTGDTGAYGLDITKGRANQKKECLRVDQQYSDCDILVAHLGDIRLRELTSAMRNQRLFSPKDSPLLQLTRRFLAWPRQAPDPEFVFGDRVRDLLELELTLSLVPSEALSVEVRVEGGETMPVKRWLHQYISTCRRNQNGACRTFKRLRSTFIDLADAFLAHTTRDARDDRRMIAAFNKSADLLDNELKNLKCDRAAKNAYVIMTYLAVCGLDKWQYPFHLGIYGIYSLFQNMVMAAKGEANGVRLKSRQPLFIVGELPEELSSYRHVVARLLNMTKQNIAHARGAKAHHKHVHAFTGDIGLHIDLGPWHQENGGKATPFAPKIRCAFCNYNNELVCKGKSYHSPDKILETPIKRREASMIYLCTDFDHHPQDIDHPRHFLSRPELRVI